MRRCVIPRGSSAARWRQAVGRCYSAAAEGPGARTGDVVKKARERPRKGSESDTVGSGSTEAGTGRDPSRLMGTYTPLVGELEPEVPAKRARGGSRKIKGERAYLGDFGGRRSEGALLGRSRSVETAAGKDTKLDDGTEAPMGRMKVVGNDKLDAIVSNIQPGSHGEPSASNTEDTGATRLFTSMFKPKPTTDLGSPAFKTRSQIKRDEAKPWSPDDEKVKLKEGEKRSYGKEVENSAPSLVSNFKPIYESELTGKSQLRPISEDIRSPPRTTYDQQTLSEPAVTTQLRPVVAHPRYPPRPSKPLTNTSFAPPTDILPPPREKPLPISPLMDPAFLAAKEKYKSRKGPPTKGEPGSLHARLAKNPYALALATPIRQCGVTGSLLPSFFLQDFNMMAHPTTGEPWYVPTSLTKYESPKAKTKTTKEPSLEATDCKTADKQTEPVESSAKPGKKIGYNAYTLSSKHTLDQMQLNRFHPAKWVPQRIRRLPTANRVASSAGLRPDMGTFIMSLWRRRISESLVHIKGLKKGYLVNCTDWEDAKSKAQVGAFLYVGDDAKNPGQWATVDVPWGLEGKGESRKVPVYNLRALLGDDVLGGLMGRVEHSVEGVVVENGIEMGTGKRVLGGEIVALKDKRVTLDLRMKLWKFRGFMAVPVAGEAEQELVWAEDQDGDDDWDDEGDYEDEHRDEDEDEDGDDDGCRGEESKSSKSQNRR